VCVCVCVSLREREKAGGGREREVAGPQEVEDSSDGHAAVKLRVTQAPSALYRDAETESEGEGEGEREIEHGRTNTSHVGRACVGLDRRHLWCGAARTLAPRPRKALPGPAEAVVRLAMLLPPSLLSTHTPPPLDPFIFSHALVRARTNTRTNTPKRHHAEREKKGTRDGEERREGGREETHARERLRIRGDAMGQKGGAGRGTSRSVESGM
jgi:hypothetical protein